MSTPRRKATPASIHAAALRRIAETPKEGERCEGYPQAWDDEPGRAVEEINHLIEIARSALRRAKRATP